MAELSTAEAPPTVRPVRPKVIYVMGAGHSGSTILGVTLGNCANVFFAGEVEEWLVNSGVPPLGGTERTRFWSEVRGEVDAPDELFGGAANRYMERSSALLRIHYWPVRRRLRGRYRRVAEDLYRAIARSAGSTHVVDTSHFPLRARELKTLSGIELYLVFLVRHPQSVVASYIRHISRREVAERRLRVLSTNANLWLTHVLSLFVFLGHPRDRRLFLRHEDFLADPEAVLREILTCVESSAPIPDLTSLRTGFPLIGNKLIRSEVVALEGPSASPVRSSWLTTLLQLPWRFIFSRLAAAATATAADQPSSPAES